MALKGKWSSTALSLLILSLLLCIAYNSAQDPADSRSSHPLHPLTIFQVPLLVLTLLITHPELLEVSFTLISSVCDPLPPPPPLPLV